MRLAEVQKQLEKQFGKNVMLRGDSAQAVALEIKRIPTGVFALDYATAGGLPMGRISLLSGGKGSGKSTVALKVIGQWMQATADRKKPPLAAWMDEEGVFDPRWAAACGVDVARLLVCRPAFGEEAVDVFIKWLAVSEIEVLGFDSIAAMVPAVELESSALDQQRGVGARMTNKFMRQVPALLNAWEREGAPRTVILLNQLRQKITGFGTAVPMTEPGGLGQIFSASIVIRSRRMKYEFEEEAHQKDATGPLYAVNTFKIEQSKVSPPHVEGEYRLGLRDAGLVHRAHADGWEAFMLRAQQTGYCHPVEKQGWGLGDASAPGALTARTKEALFEIVRTDPAIYRAEQAKLIAWKFRLVPVTPA